MSQLLEVQKEKEQKELSVSISSLKKDFNNQLNTLKTQNKTDVESLIVRKTQEVSKNTFEKINTEFKLLIARINELTNDVDSVKELRTEVLDDMTQLLDVQKEKEQKSSTPKSIAQKLESVEKELAQMKNNGVASKIIALENETSNIKNKFENEFEEKLNKFNIHIDKLTNLTGEFEQKVSNDVNQKIAMIEKENEILRNELNDLKNAYFQMVQLQQQAPIIIE